jgi:hypothetical protein
MFLGEQPTAASANTSAHATRIAGSVLQLQWRMPCSEERRGESVTKSQPDGTQPLPETAELGGEGGTYGDGASRESHRSGGNERADTAPITDIAGYVTRLPEVHPDDQPAAGEDIKKHPTDL